ncbi:MAG TPA: hypothetical protein VKO18_10620 [Terriglobia bacterium]|nr:hypothetical protein [Terriglobia bacterium]
MLCPLCGARTEVSEKRGPYRDRRCTNADCGHDFTTRENILPVRKARLCARTRALHGGVLPLSAITGIEVGSIAIPRLDAPSDPVDGEKRRDVRQRRLQDDREFAVGSDAGREGPALRAS